MAKFKDKKGRIIEVATMYQKSILSCNPNYTEIKSVKKKKNKVAK